MGNAAAPLQSEPMILDNRLGPEQLIGLSGKSINEILDYSYSGVHLPNEVLRQSKTE